MLGNDKDLQLGLRIACSARQKGQQALLMFYVYCVPHTK